MKMFRLLVAIALGGLCFVNTPSVLAAVADVGKEIEACERATWEAFRNHQPGVFKALCCPEFYEISEDGSLVFLADVLKDMSDYQIQRYSITEVQVTAFADNVAMMRYKLEVVYVHKGKELPLQRSFSNVVYVKRAGHWLAAFYQETQRK